MTNSSLYEKMLNAMLLSCTALRNNTSADDGLRFRTKVRNKLRSSMDDITPKATYAFGTLADLQNVEKDDVSADLFHAYTLTLRWLHDRAKQVRTIFTDSAGVYSKSGFIFRRVLPTRKNECVGYRLLIQLRQQLIQLRQQHGPQAAPLVAQGEELVQLQKRRRLLKKRRKRSRRKRLVQKRQRKKERKLQKKLLKRALICISGAVKGLVYTLNWVAQKTNIY